MKPEELLKPSIILALGALGLLSLTTNFIVIPHELGHILGGLLGFYPFPGTFHFDLATGTGGATNVFSIFGNDYPNLAGAYAIFLIIPFLMIRHAPILGLFTSIFWFPAFIVNWQTSSSSDFSRLPEQQMIPWTIYCIVVFIALHELVMWRIHVKKSNKAKAHKSDMAEYVAQVNAIKARD